MQPLARHATPTQRDTLIRVLVEGFRADPLMALMMPEAGASGLADGARLTRMMECEVDRHLPLGHTYRIDDRCASLWTPPGIDAEGEAFVELMGELTDPEVMASLTGSFIEVMQWKPETPHFYLHMISAADRARGQGLGSVMLGRVLEICDREGVDAYLEASTARSAALYARHGFETLATVHFSDNVALHPMLRSPA